MIRYWIFQTLIGDGCIIVSKVGICRLILPGFSREKMKRYIDDLYPEAEPGREPAPVWVRNAINFVKGYLAGEIGRINARLDLEDLTGFQKKVLRTVCRIKPGETRSYAWVAKQVGHPGAVRAVARALARNPVPVFIPCHRVIGQDGSLKGFSAPGGVNMKRYLLNLERGLRRV